MKIFKRRWGWDMGSGPRLGILPLTLLSSNATGSYLCVSGIPAFQKPRGKNMAAMKGPWLQPSSQRQLLTHTSLMLRKIALGTYLLPLCPRLQ